MLSLYYFVTKAIRAMNYQTFFQPAHQPVSLPARPHDTLLNLALLSPENMS